MFDPLFGNVPSRYLAVHPPGLVVGCLVDPRPAVKDVNLVCPLLTQATVGSDSATSSESAGSSRLAAFSAAWRGMLPE